MCKALIIGAGGVGTVVTQKIAANPVFTDVMLASRTKSKCDAVAAAIGGNRVKTAEVDADSVPQLCELFRAFKPDIVVNVALPYQDLTIMDACLECGCNYLDTANYEPKDEAHFEYSWQWAYQDRFKAAGLTAILGCGFDPGVTAIFTAYAAKHHFDEIHYLDIVDCNAGNHGMAFATNFNPEINIREVTQKGRYYENGEWVVTEPHEIHKPLNYPGIGERESYVIYHEELESLVKNYPTIRRARFWMTFGQEYLTHLRVIQNIGMARIDPIIYNGVEIVPILLHVGLGTFRPVNEESIEDHQMHSEWYSVSEETAKLINETRAAGHRVIAVGTTSCRTLESVWAKYGKIVPCSGNTSIFIYPGVELKAIDGLITNFHLPESTLIMLIAAFYGYDKTMAAYKVAVEEKYRFFSFGDAMFIR